MRKTAFAALAMVLAAGCVSTAAQFPARMSAIGTEPFWNLTIDGERVGFSEPDRPEPRIGKAVRAASSGMALSLAGTLDGEPIGIEIAAGPCSDGMSDRSYPYQVSVKLGVRLLSGCAFEQGSLTDRP